MSEVRTPRNGVARPTHIKRACAGSWVETAPLIGALLAESGHQPGWKPGRAAAVRALAPAPVWMTHAELLAWLDQHAPARLHGGAQLLEREFNIGRTRRKSLVEGAAVTRVEALAFAHYAAGLKPPIAAGDAEAFGDWFAPRFGPAAAVSRALGLSTTYINDRLRGYDIGRVGRVERLPEASLIRALDWVWRVGPFSPYGERASAPLFPGQPAGL